MSTLQNWLEPHKIPFVAAIDIEGLSFSYSKQTVFDNFCFTTNSALVLLEGPSGCGKSTLLKVLSGYLKPTSCGRMLLPGNSKLLLQEDALFPWLTVKQNLGIVGVTDSIQADHLSPLWPWLAPIWDKRASQLSFGQRRTVELFRVFATPGAFVCLDEPFNFLDPIRRRAAVQCIQRLSESGVSFVITSHYGSDLTMLGGPRYIFTGELPVHSLHSDLRS